MYLFHDLKMIYIKVPKTGTQSFMKCTCHHKHEYLGYNRGRFSEHWTAKQTKNLTVNKQSNEKAIDPAIWDSYEKIGFIRHPYTWIRSFYYERLPNHMLHQKRELPYKEYIRAFNIDIFRWFVDDDGKMLIDTVYRLEDFDEIMRNKFNAEPCHIHKTATNDPNTLNEEDKEIIRAKFPREMEYYK